MASTSPEAGRPYDQRWIEIWEAGLNAGEVRPHICAAHRTSPFACILTSADLVTYIGYGRCHGWLQRFDTSMVAPSLVDLVSTGKLQVKGQHVFIPGCG